MNVRAIVVTLFVLALFVPAAQPVPTAIAAPIDEIVWHWDTQHLGTYRECAYECTHVVGHAMYLVDSPSVVYATGVYTSGVEFTATLTISGTTPGGITHYYGPPLPAGSEVTAIGFQAADDEQIQNWIAGGGKINLSCESAPTAVKLVALSAVSASGMIIISWESATEIDNLGYNLYRRNAYGLEIKLNQELIPSQGPGSPVGYVYTFTDTLAPPEWTLYRLEDVDIQGIATSHFVTVTVPSLELLSFDTMSTGPRCKGSSGSIQTTWAVDGPTWVNYELYLLIEPVDDYPHLVASIGLTGTLALSVPMPPEVAEEWGYFSYLHVDGPGFSGWLSTDSELLPEQYEAGHLLTPNKAMGLRLKPHHCTYLATVMRDAP